MHITDYLISEPGQDWPELVRGWAPLLPPRFDLWLANRFGDLFVVPDDGTVVFLDVGAGVVETVAGSREHFATLLGEGNNFTMWFMVPLVDACVAAGLTLGEGQCYGFKVPPRLGGAYDVANVTPQDLAVHYWVLADVYRQTQHSADGASIKSVSLE